MSDNVQPLEQFHGLSHYCVLYGDFTRKNVAHAIAQLSSWTHGQNTEVHISFYSGGGEVSAGIQLYDFLRAYPIPVTLYAGQANSIAAVAFLGASRRVISPHSKFMLHGVVATVPAKATIKELRDAIRSASLDDDLVESILQQHLNLSADDWRVRREENLWFSPEEALTAGFSTEPAFGRFDPPKGSRLIYLYPETDTAAS